MAAVKMAAVDVRRTSGQVYCPMADFGSQNGEGLVGRMQAKFSEHSNAPAAKTPLFRRLIAPVEKFALLRGHHQAHPTIQKRMARFDEGLHRVGEEERKAEEKKAKVNHRYVVLSGEEQTRDGLAHPSSLHLTMRALQRQLREGEHCVLVWEAIVSWRSKERSWPSIVAVVVNQQSDACEAALFVLAAIEHENDPLRIRVVLPLTSKSTINTLGSGSLGVKTLLCGEREAFHMHMSSVQSLWVAFSTVNGLLGKTDRKKKQLTGDETWLDVYTKAQEEDVEWDSDLSSTPSSSSSSTDSLSADEGVEPEVRKEIILALRDILHDANLEELTCGIVYKQLAQKCGRDLRPLYKRFIDEKMLMVMGQMEVSTEIFDDFLYLGSEWNASNLDELEQHNIDCVLNVTREIPALYPDKLIYHRVPIWDTPSEDLLPWLTDAVDFIIQAQKRGSRCLVHCQRGISRSASMVIAYGMKAHGWTLERSFSYVKARRQIVKPNQGFWRQLQHYETVLLSRGNIKAIA